MLIDVHSHLDRYGESLEAALAQVRRERILTVSNSMDLPSYSQNVEIGRRCAFVLPCFGVHPWNAPIYVDRLADLDGALEETPIVGEIGLDHHFVRDVSHYPAQRTVFEYCLSAARDHEKIVVLHTKGAEEEILELLDQYRIERAVVHWYSGPQNILKKLISRGTYFTIGIEVIYSEDIRFLARRLPSDRLLTETDNPGGPKSFTGTPGMPVLLKDVITTLAHVRKLTVGDLIQMVEANFVQLIENDPRLSAVLSMISLGEQRPPWRNPSFT